MGQQPTLELTKDSGDFNFDSAANQARQAWQTDLDQTVSARASGVEDPLLIQHALYATDGTLGGQANAQDGQLQQRALSPAMQQSRAALEALVAAPDKSEALWDLRPRFEDAIKTADASFTTTVTEVGAELKQLKPAMDAVAAIMKPHQDNFKAEFAKVKDEEKPAAAAFLQKYSSLKPDDPVRAQMAEAMESRYPGLIPAVDRLEKALVDNAPQIKPLNEKLEGINGRLGAALSDRVNTRIAYSMALRSGGDDAKSAEVYEDAERIANGLAPVTPEERQERFKRQFGIKEA